MSFSEDDLTSNPTTCTPNTSRSKPTESAYNESFYNLPLIKRSASSFLEARYTPSMQREGPLTSMDSINYSVIYDAKNISMHEYSHEQDEMVVKIVPTKEQQVRHSHTISHRSTLWHVCFVCWLLIGGRNPTQKQIPRITKIEFLWNSYQ